MANEILLVCNDLIFSAKITGTAKALNVPTRVTPSIRAALGAVSKKTRMMLVDLASPPSTSAEDLAELRRSLAPEAAMVAYGSHVETDRLRQAREAGCDLVLTRSQFVEQLVNLLQEGVDRPDSDSSR